MDQLTTADKIIQTRAGGRVQRCHALGPVPGYTNDRHSWGVAMLMWQLWRYDFSRLGIYCLGHDVPEFIVGDMVSPVLRYAPREMKDYIAYLEDSISTWLDIPWEGELSEEDFRKLKACDHLEFYITCREEAQSGNKFVLEGLAEIRRYFTETPLPEPANGLFLQLEKLPELKPRQAGVVLELASGWKERF